MANKIIQLKDGNDNIFPNILDAFYPIGTIYETLDNNFNPNTRWGGTWEKVTDRFLVGAGGSYGLGTTGGEAEHKLTGDEIPMHAHTQTQRIPNGAQAGQYWGAADSLQWYSSINADSTGAYGSSQPHNNLPPYLAVNIWKRTA